MPTNYSIHDKGLSTQISQVDRDAFGRKLPMSTRLQMWRLRKWQIRSRVHSSSDRNLAQAMAELERLSSKVSISAPIKEKAAVAYRKALDKGLVRGRSINAIVAASLYAACRKSGAPKSLSEISEASLVDKKDVARCYRLLLQELDFHMPISDALTYVSKIAEKNGISGKTQGAAIAIACRGEKKKVFGRKRSNGHGCSSTLHSLPSTKRKDNPKRHCRRRRSHRSHGKKQIQSTKNTAKNRTTRPQSLLTKFSPFA